MEFFPIYNQVAQRGGGGGGQGSQESWQWIGGHHGFFCVDWMFKKDFNLILNYISECVG